MLRMPASILLFVAVIAAHVAAQLPQQMIPKEVAAPARPGVEEPDPLPAGIDPMTPFPDPLTGEPVLALDRTYTFQLLVEVDNQCDWTVSVGGLQDAIVGTDVPPGKSYLRAFIMMEDNARNFAGGQRVWHYEETQTQGSAVKTCEGVETTLKLPKIVWVDPVPGAPKQGHYVLPYATVVIPMTTKTTDGPNQADPPTTPVAPDDVVPTTPDPADRDYPAVPVPGATPPAVDEDSVFDFNASDTSQPLVNAAATSPKAGGLLDPLQRKTLDFDDPWKGANWKSPDDTGTTDRSFQESDDPFAGFDVPVDITGDVVPQFNFVPDFSTRDGKKGALMRGLDQLLRLFVTPVHAAMPASIEQAAQSGKLYMFLADRGGSTGRSMVMQVVNLTGKPVRFRGMLAIEPLAKDAQNAAKAELKQVLARHKPLRLSVNAYCSEFLKLPPEPGQVFRVAPPNLQNQLNPLKRVMASANQLAKKGALNPDSNATSYRDSIKQWAMWTVEQKFNEKRFGEAFLSHTKKNLEGAGQKWTKQFEDIVKQRTPNRWNDIVQILKSAGAAVPQ